MRKAVFDRGLEGAAADVDGHQTVAERQFGENLPPRDCRARGIDLVAADAAAVSHRHLGLRRPPHRIGDEVADGGLARAHRGSATVELDRGCSDRRVESLVQLILELCDDCRDFGVGRRHRGVDNAELRPPPYTTPSAIFTDIDD